MVVQNTIVPKLPISQVIERWPLIKKQLMNNGRKREYQLGNLEAYV